MFYGNQIKVGGVVLVVGVLLLCSAASAEEEGLVRPKVQIRKISVGGVDADVGGYTSAGIQIAVDALKNSGGGVVKLGKGTFEISAPVRLGSNISLVGSGEETVLHKIDGVRSPLAEDCGYGKLRLRVKDVSGFKPGIGVIIQDSKNDTAWDVTTAVITDIEGDMVYIDDYTARDYQSGLDGIISSACSLIEAVDCENVQIARLVVSGNKAANEYLGGCRGGGIYLHRSRKCVVEEVTVRDFNGDGFSWQTTEDITVRKCRSQDNANFGFHPGTGSERTRVEKCTAVGNGTDGIFVCWRVRDSVFTGNTSHGNGRHGISVGHKDTDNLFEGNYVYENGVHGVYLRDEIEQNGAHRNTFRRNVVENNGTKDGGYGFCVEGVTRDIVIEQNTIRDTGKGFQNAGIFIGEEAQNVSVDDNDITGHAEAEVIGKSGP
jgi:hypothetical protein